MLHHDKVIPLSLGNASPLLASKMSRHVSAMQKIMGWAYTVPSLTVVYLTLMQGAHTSEKS